MSVTPKKNTCQATDNSMAPIFVKNDIVYYKSVAFKDIKEHDIVIIRKAHAPLAHRVVYKGKKFILTKGDNNLHNDGKVYLKQIMGRVYKIKQKENEYSPEDLYRLQTLFYFNQIHAVINILNRHKIPFVFLKGLPLYLHYTKNGPKRLYSDCDILVRPKDFHSLKKLLGRAGYRYMETTPIKFSRDGIRPEYAFIKETNGVPVIFDVHTEPVFLMAKVPTERFYPGRSIDAMTEDYIKGKHVTIVEGHKYSILSPVHLIVYLALHFFHHNYRGSYRLSFLNLIIHEEIKAKNQKEVEALWVDIIDHISDYALQNIVYPCFFFLRKYYHTPIPEHIIESLKPHGLTRWYIEKKVLTIDPYTDQTIIESGTERFVNIFMMTPESIFKKTLTFFDVRVISLTVEVIKGKFLSRVLSTKEK